MRLWSKLLLPWEERGKNRNRKVTQEGKSLQNWALMAVPGTGGVQPLILSYPTPSHPIVVVPATPHN